MFETEFKDVRQVWFVMDCGGEIGNAAKYNRQLCDKKGFVYMGTAQILMPENYKLLPGRGNRVRKTQLGEDEIYL